MGKSQVARTIQAPQQLVWDTVSNIDNYSTAIPEIVNVEFLSEQRVGVGTRFRETRQMGKREGQSDLEVTEYSAPDHIRLVSDQGGVIWDTIYTVRDLGEGATELKLEMDSRPYRLVPKFILPIVLLMIKKFVEKDMDRVKEYCEEQGEPENS
jgi:hypothetical protein